MSARLPEVVQALEEIAPTAWAAEWDNPGLLLEPPGRTRVERVLLAIDLTPAVLEEARRARAELIVAYHPPIFAPLSRITCGAPLARVLLACVQAKIAVYAPHTALDAAPDGVNDWLAGGVGKGARSAIGRAPQHAGAPAEVGFGRAVELDAPVSVATLVRRVKAHLGVAHLRVAAPARRAPLRRILVCAGAGGSVLAGAEGDAYVTGEMRHHDVLAAVARGVTVVLSEHSHTERGYLAVYARRLRAALGDAVVVRVARSDREPLVTM
jgi:dinuclear metal center YbgI/SA1388 family protein